MDTSAPRADYTWTINQFELTGSFNIDVRLGAKNS